MKFLTPKILSSLSSTKPHSTHRGNARLPPHGKGARRRVRLHSPHTCRPRRRRRRRPRRRLIFRRQKISPGTVISQGTARVSSPGMTWWVRARRRGGADSSSSRTTCGSRCCPIWSSPSCARWSGSTVNYDASRELTKPGQGWALFNTSFIFIAAKTHSADDSRSRSQYV
jgi:hypothetical protein